MHWVTVHLAAGQDTPQLVLPSTGPVEPAMLQFAFPDVQTCAHVESAVQVQDVRALNDNELSILSDDLNSLSILDGDILDYNTILIVRAARYPSPAYTV